MLSIERLAALRARAGALGLEFALAGRLQVGDLSRLVPIRPDIIGVRSAACRAGVRTGEIDAAAVRRFREALQAHAAPIPWGGLPRPASAGATS